MGTLKFLVMFLAASVAIAFGAETGNGVKAIVIDRSLSKATLPAWLAYAGARVEVRKNLKDDLYTFDEEAKARQACADVWAETRTEGSTSDVRYLNDLLFVRQAGFIREYTWVYFRVPEWTVLDDLRLEEFTIWQNQHLKGHTPETRVRIDY